jgi:hypothetical protein
MGVRVGLAIDVASVAGAVVGPLINGSSAATG